jgi:CobW/HypB/UreG, nucleotide-binding domain
MPAVSLSAMRESAPPIAPPHCIFVTGPLKAGKTRWIQSQIQDLAASQPGARCAVLLAEEGRTSLTRLAKENADLTLARLSMPCFCCPALVGLPDALNHLTATVRTDCLFIEAPAMAAAGLLGEFDRAFGWPRELVVCLDRLWIRAMQEQNLSPFQMALLDLADRLVAVSIPGGVHGARICGATPNPDPEAAAAAT